MQWPGLTVSPGLWSIVPGRSVGLSTSQPSAQRSASTQVNPEQHKTDTTRVRVFACVCVCVKERPAPNWFGWHLSKTKPTFLFTPWLRPSRSHILSVTHTRSHTRVGTHTYSAACTIACLFFRECVRKELWIAFYRSPQRASYSGLTKSYNPVPWNMYKLSHWLLPACSLPDVLPINNPPSSPLSWTRRSLLLLSSYRSTTFSSLLSPVSLSLLPFLTHNPSSTFFLPLTLSRSLPVEFSCQPRTDAGLVQTRANDHITKNKARQRKQAGGGEREAEQRRDSSSVLSQPKIEENCRKPWLKKAWTIQTNCHGVNILWRLETEQWGGVGVGRVQSNSI